jgi:hypothetical protein
VEWPLSIETWGNWRMRELRKRKRTRKIGFEERRIATPYHTILIIKKKRVGFYATPSEPGLLRII